MKIISLCAILSLGVISANASLLGESNNTPGGSQEVQSINILSVKAITLKTKQNKENKDLGAFGAAKYGEGGALGADVINSEANQKNGVRILYRDTNNHRRYFNQIGKLCEFKKGVADLTTQNENGKIIEQIEPNSEC